MSTSPSIRLKTCKTAQLEFQTYVKLIVCRYHVDKEVGLLERTTQTKSSYRDNSWDANYTISLQEKSLNISAMVLLVHVLSKDFLYSTLYMDTVTRYIEGSKSISIYEIGEKSPQKHSEGNTTMSAVVTL